MPEVGRGTGRAERPCRVDGHGRRALRRWNSVARRPGSDPRREL